MCVYVHWQHLGVEPTQVREVWRVGRENIQQINQDNLFLFNALEVGKSAEIEDVDWASNPKNT